jgi:hypothetical protein
MISVGSLPLCGWPLLQEHESRCRCITVNHRHIHFSISHDFLCIHICTWEAFRSFYNARLENKSRLPHDNSSFQVFFCFTLWPTCDIQYKRIKRRVFMFQEHENRTQWTGWWNNYSNKSKTGSVSNHPENNTYWNNVYNLRLYSRSTEFEFGRDTTILPEVSVTF